MPFTIASSDSIHHSDRESDVVQSLCMGVNSYRHFSLVILVRKVTKSGLGAGINRCESFRKDS